MPATECPDLLPRCLKTWIFITSCTDTADPSCYCPQEEFVNKVVGCLDAWSSDDDEVTSAVEYFLGLCAPYVDENPAIVTAIPSTITLPTPSPDVPNVTIIQTITTVVPCEPTTVTTGSASGTVVTVSTSTATQTLTIPQVTLVVTATDATLVYPTSDVAATSAPPATATTIPTGVPAVTTPVSTTLKAIETSLPSSEAGASPSSELGTSTTVKAIGTTPALTSAPGLTTAPAAPTTLVTYPVGSGANATGTAVPVTTSGVPLFTGAASGIVPGTIVAVVGALAVVLLQL